MAYRTRERATNFRKASLRATAVRFDQLSQPSAGERPNWSRPLGVAIDSDGASLLLIPTESGKQRRERRLAMGVVVCSVGQELDRNGAPQGTAGYDSESYLVEVLNGVGNVVLSPSRLVLVCDDGTLHDQSIGRQLKPSVVMSILWRAVDQISIDKARGHRGFDVNLIGDVGPFRSLQMTLQAREWAFAGPNGTEILELTPKHQAPVLDTMLNVVREGGGRFSPPVGKTPVVDLSWDHLPPLRADAAVSEAGADAGSAEADRRTEPPEPVRRAPVGPKICSNGHKNMAFDQTCRECGEAL